MFGAWLIASRGIRSCIHAVPESGNPIYVCFGKLHPVYRYGLAFLLIYTLLNFFMSLPWPHSGNALFDWKITPVKLRGLSGFWLLFYSLAAVFSCR